MYIYRCTRYEVSRRRPFIYIFSVRVGFSLFFSFTCVYKYNIICSCFFSLFFFLRCSVCSPSAHARISSAWTNNTAREKTRVCRRGWDSARPERLNNNIIIITISNYRFSQPPPGDNILDGYKMDMDWLCGGGVVEIYYYYTMDHARVNMTYAADGRGGLKRLRLCGFTARWIYEQYIVIYIYIRASVHALLNDDL